MYSLSPRMRKCVQFFLPTQRFPLLLYSQSKKETHSNSAMRVPFYWIIKFNILKVHSAVYAHDGRENVCDVLSSSKMAFCFDVLDWELTFYILSNYLFCVVWKLFEQKHAFHQKALIYKIRKRKEALGTNTTKKIQNMFLWNIQNKNTPLKSSHFESVKVLSSESFQKINRAFIINNFDIQTRFYIRIFSATSRKLKYPFTCAQNACA